MQTCSRFDSTECLCGFCVLRMGPLATGVALNCLLKTQQSQTKLLTINVPTIPNRSTTWIRKRSSDHDQFWKNRNPDMKNKFREIQIRPNPWEIRGKDHTKVAHKDLSNLEPHTKNTNCPQNIPKIMKKRKFTEENWMKTGFKLCLP